MDIQYWSGVFNLIGFSAGLRYALMRRLMRRGLYKSPYFQIKPTGFAAPISLRSAPSSDVEAFEQIFINQEYQPIAQIPEARLILDLGANIGLASLYFMRQFPNAEIIAVEPDPRNFAMLQKNAAPYPQITPIQGAIWHSSQQLQLAPGVYKDRKEWATQVMDGFDGGIQAFDVPSLAKDRVIDLLKIDIERSEIQLFSKNTGWLPQVKNLCIELHDEECTDVFFKAMEPFDYNLSRSGELTFCQSMRQGHLKESG